MLKTKKVNVLPTIHKLTARDYLTVPSTCSSTTGQEGAIQHCKVQCADLDNVVRVSCPARPQLIVSPPSITVPLVSLHCFIIQMMSKQTVLDVQYSTTLHYPSECNASLEERPHIPLKSFVFVASTVCTYIIILDTLLWYRVFLIIDFLVDRRKR